MMIVMTLLVVLAPIALMVGLLWLAEVRRRHVAARVALQIRLTDAVHWELGAVAAPEVESGRRGGWRVRMRVPAGRPGLVGPLVQIAERILQGATTRPFEIVLLPPMPAPRSTRASHLSPLAAGAR